MNLDWRLVILFWVVVILTICVAVNIAMRIDNRIKARRKRNYTNRMRDLEWKAKKEGGLHVRNSVTIHRER